MPTPRFTKPVARLATLLEPTRQKLYEYVCDQGRPVGRDEAASAVNVSRAMAAFHLDRLVESGLLRAEYRRLAPGRGGRGTGRPSKLYRRSRHGLNASVPPRAHELLARLLAQVVNQTDERLTPREAGHRVGRSLGLRARRRLSARPSRARMTACVGDVLANIGFEPGGGLPPGSTDIRSRNCPFDPVSRHMPDVVCQAAIGIVAGAIDGVGAHHLEARRDARPGLCCVVLTGREGEQPAD